MRVILLERMENLGQMGDEVAVSPGYARNFLLPRKKALRATEANREHFQKQRAQLEAESLKRKDEAAKVAKKIENISVTILRQAGEAGQLYGSVQSRDIADAVTQSGCTINRGQVTIETPIKIIGVYGIKVTLHPEVTVQVIANVARSDEEALVQAEAVKNGRPLGAMPPLTEDDRKSEPKKGKKQAAETAEEAPEASAEAPAAEEGEEKPKAKKAKSKKSKDDADAA